MHGFDFAGTAYTVSIWAIPILFAITVHEVAHGWVAKQCGDMTAHNAGRLTLNPIKHIDPIGTVVVPLAMLILTAGGPVFGWAKPVPVVVENLHNPRRDMVLVAAAGPGVNLLMAFGWSVLIVVQYYVLKSTDSGSDWLLQMCRVGIYMNVILAVFNLLPIPPLDGGRVVTSFLPSQAARFMRLIEPFGFVILLVLLFTGGLWAILDGPIASFTRFFSWLVNASIS